MFPLPRPTLIDQRQSRLLNLAAIFMVCQAAALTLSSAARERSWEVAYRWEHWLALIAWLALVNLAHQMSARHLPGRDPLILPVAALLSGWGVMEIWRLSTYFGQRQTTWLLVALGILIIGLRKSSDLNFLRRNKYLWLTSGLLLTALTLLLGTNPSGGDAPRLWLGCCGIYLQPSEPLKLLLIIYLAAYLAGRSNPDPTRQSQETALDEQGLLPYLAPTMLMTGLALLLLIAQRDLGTAALFLFIYTTMVYLRSVKKRILLIMSLILLASAGVGYILFDVVRLRMEAWINPWLDPSGRSFQIVQSLLAVANGGLFGRGTGMGNPGLVPISHSDFIFASISEETGLLGGLGLILLMALLSARSLTAAFRASDPYQRYLAAGLGAHLAGQSILIIGGNLRLLPLTGVTLPFVSYGGSSLLTSFLAVLMLLHISNSREPSSAPILNPRPFLHLGGLLLLGLGSVSLSAGWWAVVRGPDLLTRTDNARRSIADRYVLRGAILDRSNTPLAISSGEPGAYRREVLYPSLSPVLGYSSPLYGQSGLEAGQDEYLRGTKGNPTLVTWWNHLLYGQPPPGLDIRTSLDIRLQQAADDILAEHIGAIVLVNADNGEIMAMASHPTFDANLLEQEWQQIINDINAPLVNRPIQGQYPLGELAGEFFPEGVPSTRLEIPEAFIEGTGNLLGVKRQELHFSPLQMALAAAAVSNGGVKPAPLLVVAVNTPAAGWVILSPDNRSKLLMQYEYAQSLADRLAVKDFATWQIVKTAQISAANTVTWYLGGSMPDWKGINFALCVLLEENNTSLAVEIGQAILQAAMHP